jgi:hypothetical protein
VTGTLKPTFWPEAAKVTEGCPEAAVERAAQHGEALPTTTFTFAVTDV